MPYGKPEAYYSHPYARRPTRIKRNVRAGNTSGNRGRTVNRNRLRRRTGRR